MKKQLFPILALLVALAGCRNEDPIPEPDPEPEPVDTSLYYLDTTYSVVDTFRIDTIGIDTIRHDSLMQVDNNLRVVAYTVYYSSKLPHPEYVTNIHYGFAELYMDADSNYVKFELQNKSTGLARLQKVIALKQKNPNLKISLSFTHTVSNSDNSQRGGFSVLSADPAMRKKFAEDCLAFCQQYGLDGIDLDWEFPGISWSGHHADPAHDVDNFTLLVKQLRETLGPNYLLSYAGADFQVKQVTGGTAYIDNMACEPYVDYVGMMCYDMCSAPQPHNAISCSGYWDITRSWQTYVSVGYPMEKLCLGVPFYGRHEYGDGEWYYWKLMGLMQQYPDTWTRGWSNTWKVPCAKKNGVFFCSYDDPESIAYKGQWLRDRGMGGLMYWESGGDDTKGTLSKSCWDAMKTENQTISVDYVAHLDTVAVTDTIMVITKHYIE